MENTQLRQQINQDTALFKSEMLAGSWWHSIDLGGGYVTPGVHALEELQENYRHLRLPENLSGKRLLDIGCWDGFYSFEAERHGAEVVAADCWTPENFFRAREGLNSKIEFNEMSVYEVTSEKLGQFNIVLFLGVLYHLRHPLLALEQICEVTTEYALIESHVIDDFFEAEHPIMEFYELDELGGQHDNWWGPNVECLMRMLRAAGFARCELLRRPPTRALIKAYRHWNDMPDEKSPSLKIIKLMNGTTYDQHFPHRGRQAMLAMLVEGLHPDASRDEVRVEIGGFGISPVYVGPPGGTTRRDRLQINVPIPPGLDPGPALVRLWHGMRRSNEQKIDLTWGSQW
jgi:tRNA (mo5U34)-methyltransferase